MKRFAFACLAVVLFQVSNAYRVTFTMTQPMDHVFAYYSIGGAWSLFPVPIGSVPAGTSVFELGNPTLDSWGLLGTYGTDGLISGINSSINPPDRLTFSIVFPGYTIPPIRTDLTNVYVNGVWFTQEAFRLENFALVNEEVLKSDTATATLAVYSYDDATLIGSAKFEANPTLETLAPNSQTVNLGQVTAGNLASLATYNGNAETICKYFVPNVGSPLVRLSCSYTTTKTVPVAIDLVVKAKSMNGGSFKIRGFLRNFAMSQDVQVFPDTPINLAYATFTGSATGNMSQYLSNRNLLSKIEIQQTGFSAVTVPCFGFELVNLRVSG